MQAATIPAALMICLLAAGCENMTAQQQRALSGGAIGAAGGAAIGALTGGSAIGGAILGGAGGAAVGALTSSPSAKRKAK